MTSKAWRVVAYDRDDMPVEIAQADCFTVGYAAFNAAKIVCRLPRIALLDGDRVVKEATRGKV